MQQGSAYQRREQARPPSPAQRDEDDHQERQRAAIRKGLYQQVAQLRRQANGSELGEHRHEIAQGRMLPQPGQPVRDDCMGPHPLDQSQPGVLLQVVAILPGLVLIDPSRGAAYGASIHCAIV